MVGRDDSEAITRRAAQWVARLDRGPLSPQEQQALEDWAGADIRRQGALARAMAMSARFDRPDDADIPKG